MTTMPRPIRERIEAGPRTDGEGEYVPATWERWLTGIPHDPYLVAADSGRIDRAGMCDYVSRVATASPVDAFIRVLQWGYGSSGRGPSRARRMLVGGTYDPKFALKYDASVGERLARSVEAIPQLDPEGAYRHMRSGDGYIRGLGPAFFTKWLYAVSAAGDPRNPLALPVLDNLVQTWLRREEGVKLSYGSASDYATYVALLDEWKSPNDGVERLDVELAIFRLEREHRAAARKSSSKNVPA